MRLRFFSVVALAALASHATAVKLFGDSDSNTHT